MTLLMAFCAHLSAWAQSVSTITTTEEIKHTSTVYAGEVVVEGVTQVKYLYSGDVTVNRESIQPLLTALRGMADGDYATMLEGNEFDLDQPTVGFAFCSDHELVAAMDASWSSAQNVGRQYFTDKAVAAASDADLYDIDAGFKTAVDALDVERKAEIDTSVDAGHCVLVPYDSRTSTDIYYTIEDSQVVRHSDITVIYEREATTVIYTRVELETLQETKKEFVDLGLPSGTLWATCNVGASNPHDTGLFFAWGDTEGHGSDPSDGYLFSWENYKWGEVDGEDTWFTKYCTDSSRGKDGFTDGKDELDPEDDAAYVNWGPEWRMPSKQQLDELKEQCTWTQTTLQEVNGYEVTGPNGNTIFLPTTSWRIDDMLLDGGAYWSRTTNPESDGGAYYLGWDDWGWYEYGGRLDGQCVRPVYNAVNVTLNSDDEGCYWATFYSDASYTADENTTVYTAKVSDDRTKIILTEISDRTIPAGNAVILKSSSSAAIMTCADGVEGTLANNDLQGSATDVETPSNAYMLTKGSRGVGFYHWTGTAIPGGRSYLTLSAAAAAPEFLSIDDDDPTGLEKIRNEELEIRNSQTSNLKSQTIYDLTGRRLTEIPRQGIYIKNGKIFIAR